MRYTRPGQRAASSKVIFNAVAKSGNVADQMVQAVMAQTVLKLDDELVDFDDLCVVVVEGCVSIRFFVCSDEAVRTNGQVAQGRAELSGVLIMAVKMTPGRLSQSLSRVFYDHCVPRNLEIRCELSSITADFSCC